jgi:hypothetical protein
LGSAAAVWAVGSLSLAACGDDAVTPLDAAAVKAAIKANAEVTDFCEAEQLELGEDESVTCPAVGRTENGPVEGDLELTREGDSQTVSYSISLSGPGGNQVGGGEFTVEEEGRADPTEAGDASATPIERALSEKLDGAEVSCPPDRPPPARGERLVCTARGEDEDGVAFEGEVTVSAAGVPAGRLAYGTTLQQEDGGTRVRSGTLSLD